MRTPEFWRGRGLCSTLLLPLSWLYRAGAWFDRIGTTPRHAPLPVISIGNVTVGGTGKTPTALALAPLLAELGLTPHFITRGYKAEYAHTAHRVTAADSAATVGDEALLLARVAPTWVGRDRLASATAAAENGASLVIADDALQHHALARDVSLLVLDGPYGLGNSRILPAGPQRETLATALARTDAVILIGDDAQHLTPTLNKPVFRARLVPAGDATFLREGSWLAFAGIGRPQKFWGSLRAHGATLAATRAFPDHHAYTEADLAALAAEAARLGAKLITTEKDAVKLPAGLARAVTVLPVVLAFEEPQAMQDFLRSKLGEM